MACLQSLDNIVLNSDSMSNYATPEGNYNDLSQKSGTDERRNEDLSGDEVEECVSPIYLPSNSRSKYDTEIGCRTITPSDKQIRSTQCPSPDSVMAWPGEVNDTTPIKHSLHLGSLDSPPTITNDEDDAIVAASDMTTMDFHDAQSDHVPLTPSSQEEEFPTLTRRVSFADEWGSPLKEIRVMEPPQVRRVLLLLLSPPDRKFEFLNVEYPLDDNTTVQVVLDQLPKLTANPVFRTQTFSSFAKTCKNEKLDNAVVMADCELAENELLLGILSGYPAAQIGALAVPLLLNGDIIKAVGRAKRSGRGLKNIKSGNEWRMRGKQRRRLRGRVKKAKFTFECPLETTETVYQNSKLVHADSLQPSNADDLTGASLQSSDDADVEAGHGEKVDAHNEPRTFSTEMGSLETNARSVVQQLVAASNWERIATKVTNNGHSAEQCPEHKQNSEDDNASTSSSDLEDNPSESNARSVVDQLLADEGLGDSSFESESSIDAAYTSNCAIEGIPDMDEQEGSLKYPDLLRDHLQGDNHAEKTIYWIHAVSIAAICYLTTVTMG